MANQEHESILRQGVKVWNDWRKEQPEHYFSADLTKAFLSRISLREVNLYTANLNGAYLRETDLTSAILVSAVFRGADLRESTLNSARLKGAGLSKANLRGASLVGADLRRANLTETILQGADLTGANLNGAQLIGTNLTDAILDHADISNAELGDTIFGNLDLSKVNGLESVWHHFSSIISSTTMQFSQGKLPVQFLRGCGLTDWEIAAAKLHNRDLENSEINQTLYEVYDIRAEQALQISPVFISYSHADSAFVDKLNNCLDDKGIRFWRDVTHATAGRLERQIDRAMRLHPTVLLVLSEHSLRSDWVEHEVRTARRLEKELGHDILCPIALDESWKAIMWSQRLMEQITEYNIVDFSGWRSEATFTKHFYKLVQGLDLFYK